MIFRGTHWNQTEPNCYRSSLNDSGPHNCKYTDLLRQEHLMRTLVYPLGSIPYPKYDSWALHNFSKACFGTRRNLTAMGPSFIAVDPIIVHIQNY